MTRKEFIEAYAARSGITASFASLGILDIGRAVQVALPCACGEAGCEGWAMVSTENLDHHMLFDAPEALSGAYREALAAAEKK